MSASKPLYWFPAKRYGWGWGLPATWQGWTVLIGWFAIISTVSPFIAAKSLPFFIAFMILMAGLLTAVCWLKGEPPRWRWK